MKYRFLSVFLILLAVLCVFSQETQLKRLSDSTPVNMVLVEGGRYIMGSRNGYSDEEPIHVVTVDSFYMSKYEVTQKEWQAVMGNNPSYFKGDTLPVENVSWYEAIEYCNRLSVKEGLDVVYSGSGDTIRMDITANGYRLPTEAEWEYAARGGKHKEGYEYSGSNNLDSVGWYWQNSGDTWLSGTDDDWDSGKIVANNGRPWSVGAKAPNALDLYDMSGNVFEWCWDWYEDYSSGSQTNPTGSTSGSYRVFRGGSRNLNASYCRVSNRDSDSPGNRDRGVGFRPVGFRPVRSVELDGTGSFRGAKTLFTQGMVLVEGGSYSMGSSNGYSAEKPIHEVTVDSFYMSKYEVTQKEWVAVMGNDPSYFKGDTFPVESISWYEAIEYCNTLSIKENLTPCYSIDAKANPADWGSMPTEYNDAKWDAVQMNITANGYRLPTEAEWEYAARGGKHKDDYEYSGSNSIDSVGWYDSNSGSKTHSVGTKQANALDLYDMSGNVWEWCWDWYEDYSSGSQTNPTGSTSGSRRVLRGGSWNIFASSCRVSARYYYSPGDHNYYLGFRPVRSVQP